MSAKRNDVYRLCNKIFSETDIIRIFAEPFSNNIGSRERLKTMFSMIYSQNSSQQKDFLLQNQDIKPCRLLIFRTLFIGIGAVAGASCMLIDPAGKIMGMDAMLPYFKVLPFADILFTDFVFSGIALLIVNGLTNLAARRFCSQKSARDFAVFSTKRARIRKS